MLADNIFENHTWYITFYNVLTYLMLCAKLPHLWCKLAHVQR